jgi:hypothetical protein
MLAAAVAVVTMDGVIILLLQVAATAAVEALNGITILVLVVLIEQVVVVDVVITLQKMLEAEVEVENVSSE